MLVVGASATLDAEEIGEADSDFDDSCTDAHCSLGKGG